jgi:5-amino-6-(5-phospho-D-ribitylamino)uracil phosphatase
MAIRLIALDIDGTLVDLRDQITPRVRTAISHLRDQQVQIMLATGRRYSRTWPIAARLELTTPVVTASGALIKQHPEHRTLFRAEFTRSFLIELLQFFVENGHDAVLYTDSYGQGYDFHLAQRESRCPELDEFLRLNQDSIHCDPHMMSRPPDQVFAGFVMGQQQPMLALATALEQHWPGEMYLHVIRSPRYRGYMCEIAPVGVSKWSGVQFVARQLGIADAQIAAVGDDVNDLPMIAGAGLGIAMGNAPANVQSAAKWITSSIDDDGLGMALERIIDERLFE